MDQDCIVLYSLFICLFILVTHKLNRARTWERPLASIKQRAVSSLALVSFSEISVLKTSSKLCSSSVCPKKIPDKTCWCSLCELLWLTHQHHTSTETAKSTLRLSWTVLTMSNLDLELETLCFVAVFLSYVQRSSSHIVQLPFSNEFKFLCMIRLQQRDWKWGKYELIPSSGL